DTSWSYPDNGATRTRKTQDSFTFANKIPICLVRHVLCDKLLSIPSALGSIVVHIVHTSRNFPAWISIRIFVYDTVVGFLRNNFGQIYPSCGFPKVARFQSVLHSGFHQSFNRDMFQYTKTPSVSATRETVVIHDSICRWLHQLALAHLGKGLSTLRGKNAKSSSFPTPFCSSIFSFSTS